MILSVAPLSVFFTWDTFFSEESFMPKKNKRTIDIKSALRKGKKYDDLDDGMVVVEDQVMFKQPDGREISFKCGLGGSW